MSAVVGREAELQGVEAFLDGGENDPIALAIVGEPGIGKTTLWMHAVASARARASVVLVARPAESEARLSFAGLTDLLSTVPVAVLAAIPAPQRAALDVALLRAPARRVPERRLVGTALLSLLRSLSGEAEIVIAIDDLHWLDAPSAAALERPGAGPNPRRPDECFPAMPGRSRRYRLSLELTSRRLDRSLAE